MKPPFPPDTVEYWKQRAKDAEKIAVEHRARANRKELRADKKIRHRVKLKTALETIYSIASRYGDGTCKCSVAWAKIYEIITDALNNEDHRSEEGTRTML